GCREPRRDPHQRRGTRGHAHRRRRRRKGARRLCDLARADGRLAEPERPDRPGGDGGEVRGLRRGKLSDDPHTGGSMSFRALLAFLIVAHLAPAVARAQMHHEHAAADTMSMPMPMPGMPHAGKAAGAKSRPAPKKAAPHAHLAPRVHATGHTMPMAGMDMSHPAGMHAGHAMTGLYGPYAMTREASGTAWQPDAAEHVGIHGARGPWMLMLHGMADLAWTRANGPRGGEKLFADDMVMGMASRSLGARIF